MVGCNIDSMDTSLSKLREIEKGSLACCSPWGHKQSDTTERLNNKTTTIYLQCLQPVR